MKTFEEFITEVKSYKDEAIVELVDEIRKVFEKNTLETRKRIWKALQTSKGQELMNKLILNPKSKLSDSEFKKLV